MLSRQGEAELCSPVELRLCPRPATVSIDNPTNIGQADSRAFEICRAMQALEYTKKFMRVARVKADSIVRDEENVLMTVDGGADFNAGNFSGPGVFERVAD